MKPGADWLAWTLQCLVGMAVSAGLGVYLISHSGGGAHYHTLRELWVKPDQVVPCLWGAALIGGALASHFGDQLWLRSSYLLLQPDAPAQSWASRLASGALGIFGILLLGVALFPNFRPSL